MAEERAQPENLHTIVVAGQMNPAIHHPQWYQHLKLLDDAEVAAALQNNRFIISPQMTFFSSPAFNVICTNQRWEIQTTQVEFLDRILSVAATVNDTLTHTPVVAYGFNSHSHRKVPGVQNVGKVIGLALAKLPLGLPSVGGIAGEIALTINEPKHSVLFAASQSEVPTQSDVVWLKFNSNYETAGAGGDSVHFELSPLIREHFWADHELAQKHFQSMVTGLAKLGGDNGRGD